MKTKILLSFLTLIIMFSAYGQKPVMELTFTAIDSSSYLQLDSIKVMNHTQSSDTMLYWPDTVLVLDYLVGINECNKKQDVIQIFQNYPNPVKDYTTITMYVPEQEKVSLQLTDILGRQVINTERMMDMGYHSFSFIPGSSKIYFFTAISKSSSGSSIKIINTTFIQNRTASLEYLGEDMSSHSLIKTKASKALFSFNYGDLLFYAGYADSLHSGLADVPDTDTTYAFGFATNIPCPGTPTVTYEGQIYNTVQIFSQCWMKENLNVGIMINAPDPQTDNDTIEKYCMGNQPSICDLVGGMYFWDEMMKYTNVNGGQGICPAGWHVPDNLDWQILEGNVDSQYKAGDTEWDINDWRGSDAGGNLKQSGLTYWESPNDGATDAFGFTALPGGYYVQNDFWGPGYKALFYTSNNTNMYYRNMNWDTALIKKGNGGTGLAISVRCVRD